MADRHTSRRRRATNRTILIVTNGERTEMTYLSELKRRATRSGVRVKVLFVGGEPEKMLRKLQRPNGDTSSYDEVWIVVDEDGLDRSSFVATCRKAGAAHQRWSAVVSRPCFEVWLIAHYEQVRKYATQADAHRHFRRLVPEGTAPKAIPLSFPYDALDAAVTRCHLPGQDPAPLHEVPPNPGTAMPHLVAALRGFT